jgi:hypothetical protein
LESQSPDGAVPAQEQVDNRLSTHIARAREMAARAHAERPRSDIRWRLGGTWVTIEHPRAEPQEPANQGEHQGLDMETSPSLLEVAATADRKGQASGGEPTVKKD